MLGHVLAALMLCLCMPMTQAQEPAQPGTESAPVATDATKFAKRLESVSVLIEKSSAARQIEASANPEAKARREAARDKLRLAEQAYQKGNPEEATRLLNEASKTLFQAAKLATPEQGNEQKKRRDFETRLNSVKALLQAQQRLVKEKNANPKMLAFTASIEAITRQATDLYAANKLDEARQTLDQGYALIKDAVEKMREGETLVRSLHFASKAEEYLYEIDRNDAHLMLVKMLLEEKGSAIDSMARKFIENAAHLRKQAEEAATRADHDTGVKLLEDSTTELVRAIRSAGIYVPG
jgi:hypothetical protein